MELTLIWAVHHAAQVPGRICLILISPGRSGQIVEHPKYKYRVILAVAYPGRVDFD